MPAPIEPTTAPRPSLLAAAASSVHLTGHFEVLDGDPARLVASQWQHLRTEAAELTTDWGDAHRALVETAYAAPALRALHPFTSHWALRFSTTTRPALTPVGPVLSAGNDGGFGVGTGLLAPDLGRFRTAREAVDLALRHLPPGLGPVAPGGPPRPDPSA